MLKNTQGNFFLSSMWAAEGRTDFCHVVWEWVNYDIFDQESVWFYLYFGEKVWDKNVPLPLKENAYLESVLKYFWKSAFQTWNPWLQLMVMFVLLKVWNVFL